MLVRMAGTDASEHGRGLAATRWGDTVPRRSAATVLERADLTEATRTELEQIADGPPGGESRGDR
jgi:hypothetical protein